MARENARLTHAQYQPGHFVADNTGEYSLPNGADQRFMEVVNELDGYKANFFSSEGDVMVSGTGQNSLVGKNIPEAILFAAEHFGMVKTDNYSSPHVATFEYGDETNQQ